MAHSTYIGYRKADFDTAHAKFYNENMDALIERVATLTDLAHPADTLPDVQQIAALLKPGYAPIETGYCLETDGSARVAILTSMPGVAPAMWDWWFGWHGCADNRYKLWHPKAHLSAKWQDGGDQTVYIGRTSMIEEYIGTKLEKANIRFIDPSELGLDAQTEAGKTKTVFICARIGYTQWPLDFGWLVHQIRATENGAEMRSRFWMGGQYIQIRAKGAFPRWLSAVLSKIRPIDKAQAEDILRHCAEEMNHIAAFLPQLYAELTQK